VISPGIIRRWICLAAAIGMLGSLGAASPARAQLSDLYPGFMTLEQPGHMDVTLFGGGFGSDTYGVIQEGLQFEQSVTPYVGVFGRATGYQLFVGGDASSPFNPTAAHSPRLNFGRLQGGIDFKLYPGTSLFLSGGHDVADSDGSIIEGDFSSWLLPHSPHPVNFSFSSIHDFQNAVTSTEIDLQVAVLSTERWLAMVGGGGAFYAGGFIPGAQGQGGPDLGLYYRPWRVGVAVQGGYGSSHGYGQLSLYKQLSFTE
jgi:hypothetical protein